MTKFDELKENINSLPEPFKQTCTTLLNAAALTELKFYILGVFECIDNDIDNTINKNNARNIMRLLL